MLSQFTDVTTDPLDVVLFGVGLRLLQLSKTGDSKFTQLLDNRKFTIQLGSDAENIARYYVIDNGTFSQHSGKANEPTLTITFKDSMTGVKLLTKGDATAFMVGIQNGDVKMAGDYSLLMWFNQVAKFIVPKVPEKLQPVVEQAKPIIEQAKPLIEKATPIAKDLFFKAVTLFGNINEHINEKANQSKHFYQENSQNIQQKAEEFKENLTEKAEEIKTEVVEKVAEVKEIVEEKFDDIKETTQEKLDDAKEVLTETKEQVEEKVADVKEQFQEKIADEHETPAMKKSHELEAKHADDEVIAENVETDAVNNDKSPITNITVTRHS